MFITYDAEVQLPLIGMTVFGTLSVEELFAKHFGCDGVWIARDVLGPAASFVGRP